MGRRSIQNARVLITGASSGMGRALAQQLAAYQTRLLVVARRKPLLDKLADELKLRGAASVEVIADDVTDAQVRTNIVNFVNNSWGGLDLLINNAGISTHSRFAESDAAALRQIIEVNFFAATELTRELIPHLQNGNDPLLVNIGSILGHRGIPFNSEYCASKFALRGWSESIRPELMRKGIDLLWVAPGRTKTEFFDNLIAESNDVPWQHLKGISPETVARQTVHAIERRRREIFPNWRGRLFVGLNRFCPRLIDRMLSRYG